MKCEHVFGIVYDGDLTELLTKEIMEKDIQDYFKEYTLKTYYEKMKKENYFEIFNYCPMCGKSIIEIEKDLFKEEI